MKLATYNPTVQLRTQQASVRYSPQAAAYGAVSGRDGSGMRALAHGLGAVIGTIDAIAEQNMVADVTAANTEYNRRMNEVRNGLLNTQLDGARGIGASYEGQEKKIRQEVREQFGLKYNRAVSAFNTMADKDMTGALDVLGRHEYAESEKYKQVTYNNAITDLTKDAPLLYQSPGGIDTALGKAEALASANFYGQGEEAVKAGVREAQGKIVSSVLSMAVNMGDYARMNDICNRYGKYIDPKTFATVKSLTMKRDREEQKLSFHQNMMQELGLNPSIESLRRYVAENWSYLHPRTGNYKGSHAEAWKEAQWVESRTGLPAEFIYRQWAHESAYFSSQLARENNNFGGLTQVEWNGDDNLQPDGNNYYREFKNFHEYAEAYVKDFINLYDGTENVKTLADFAHYLKENKYYGADEADYLAAMERVEMEIDGDEPEQVAPSGIEFENAVQDAMKYLGSQRNIVTAENNRRIDDARTAMKQMILNGNISDIDSLPMQYGLNADGTVNEKVMTEVQWMVETQKGRIGKAAEQAAKGQPSAKVTDADLKYLDEELAKGTVTKNQIDKYCVDKGITSDEQIHKLYRRMKDYIENKGVFSIDYDNIIRRCSIDNTHFADKETHKDAIKDMTKWVYKQILFENKGQLPDGWEDILAKRVSDEMINYYAGGTHTNKGTYFTTEEQTRVPLRDIVAAGYDPFNIRRTGDDGYILFDANGKPRFMSGYALEELEKQNLYGWRD